MKSLVALVKREYLEHRGAFLYAPGVILVILAVILASGLALNRFRLEQEIGVPSALKFFEVGLLFTAGLWFAYLIAALFFYYADAFSADRRNNSMLFWKSMPVSDFQILASKMLSGLTLFPVLVLGAWLVTAVLVFAATMGGVVLMPRLVLPGIDAFVWGTLQIGVFVAASIGLALLWYAPFFAWVGALSTVVGRWSIPLAFLIPALLGLAENLVLDVPRPGSGYVLDYLKERLQFGPGGESMAPAIFREGPVDAMALLGRLLAGIDWAQLVGGLAVAALLVYLASEYRRRFIAA